MPLNTFLSTIGGLIAAVLVFIKAVEFCNAIRDRLQNDIRKELDDLFKNLEEVRLPEEQTKSMTHLDNYASNLTYDLRSAHLIMLIVLIIVAIVGAVLLRDTVASLAWLAVLLLLAGLQAQNIRLEWAKLLIIEERLALLRKLTV